MAFIQVPSSFLSAPFYEKGAEIPANQSFLHMLDSYPFYAEIVYAVEGRTVMPWLEKEKYVPLLLENWKKQHAFLTGLYKKRDRMAAKRAMIASIALLFETIYWSNQEPAALDRLHLLTHTPVNVEERMQFMLKEPDHFHSFLQLRALFEESEKIFYKIVAIQQRT